MKTFHTFFKELRENFGNSSGIIGGGVEEVGVSSPSDRAGVMRYVITQGQTRKMGKSGKSEQTDEPAQMPYIQNNVTITQEISKLLDNLVKSSMDSTPHNHLDGTHFDYKNTTSNSLTQTKGGGKDGGKPYPWGPDPGKPYVGPGRGRPSPGVDRPDRKGDQTPNHQGVPRA